MLQPADNSFGVLRLAMALAVVVSHSFYLATGIEDVSEPLHGITGYTLGQHAVQVFFILSGILVTQSLVRGGVWSFLKARALRIFPGLVVCVLLTALVLGPLASGLGARDYFSSPAVFGYIAQTLSLKTGLAPLPGVFADNPAHGVVNSSVWTLKYEVVCYLALAIAGGLALRLGVARLAGLTVLSAFLLLSIFERPDLAENNNLLQTLQYFALFFGTGVLAYVYRDALVVHWTGVVLTALLLAVTNGTRFAEFGQALFLCYVSIWVATFRFGPLRAATNRLDCSYGVYIYGVPVAQLLLLLAPGLDAYALIAVSSPIILALATLSWALIERPALALRHPRRKAGPATGPANLQNVNEAPHLIRRVSPASATGFLNDHGRRPARIVRDLKAPAGFRIVAA